MRIVTPLILAFAAATSAHAQPSAVGAWDGSTAHILSSTPNAPKYRCAYRILVTYTDGQTFSWNGNTDPPTGGTNLRVVSRSLPKPISRVDVTEWRCTTID